MIKQDGYCHLSVSECSNLISVIQSQKQNSFNDLADHLSLVILSTQSAQQISQQKFHVFADTSTTAFTSG